MHTLFPALMPLTILGKLSASQQQFQGVPTDNSSSRNEEVRLNQRKEEMKAVINRDAQHLMALRMVWSPRPKPPIHKNITFHP